MLALEDLDGMTEAEVLKHLAENYSGDKSGFDYGDISDEDIQVANKRLANMEVLVAYESVGSWGCDSSSFFLLREKTTGELYEVNGSHCSCYSFEGQLDLEETTIESLIMRIDKYSCFCTGGYDDNSSENESKVNEFVRKMAQK